MRHPRDQGIPKRSPKYKSLAVQNMTDSVNVIEITDETFEKELPHLQKVIFESAFAAFDMEFSGLETKSYHKSGAVDTVPFPDLTHA